MASLIDQELAAIKSLMEAKRVYGWEDDNKVFLARKKALERKYTSLHAGVSSDNNDKRARSKMVWGSQHGLREKPLGEHDGFESAKAAIGHSFGVGTIKTGHNRGGSGDRRYILVVNGKEIQIRIKQNEDGTFTLQEGKESTGSVLGASSDGPEHADEEEGEENEEEEEEEAEPAVSAASVPAPTSHPKAAPKAPKAANTQKAKDKTKGAAPAVAQSPSGRPQRAVAGQKRARM